MPSMCPSTPVRDLMVKMTSQYQVRVSATHVRPSAVPLVQGKLWTSRIASLPRRNGLRRHTALHLDALEGQMATFDDITDPRADPYSKDSLTVEADSDVTSGESENLHEPWQRSESGRLKLFSSMEYDETSALQQETVVGQRKHRRYTKRSQKPLYPPELLELLKESPDEDEFAPHPALGSEHLEQSMLEALRLQMRLLNMPKEGQRFAKAPLLTRKQEYFLSTIVQRAVPLMKLRDKIREQTGTTPTIETIAKAAEQELEEVRQTLNKGEDAKRMMVQYNTGFVYYTARLFKGSFAKQHRGDLIIEGLGPKGLPKAVMGFDPARGYRFVSYAYPRLRRVMTDCLTRESTAFVITPYAKYTVSKIRRAMYTLSIPKPATDEEFEAIAKEAKMTVTKVRKHLKYVRTVSLERTKKRLNKSGEEGDALVDRIEDEKSDPMEFLKQQRIREYLDVALSLLDPQERQVLTMRYGLEELHYRRPKTLLSVGKVFGLTPERIRQIELRAKRKIKHIWKNVLADEGLLQT